MNLPPLDSIIKRAKINGDQQVWSLIAPTIQALEESITSTAPEFLQDFIDNVKTSLQQTIANDFIDQVATKLSELPNSETIQQELEKIRQDEDLMAWASFYEELLTPWQTKHPNQNIEDLINLVTYLKELPNKTLDNLAQDIKNILSSVQVNQIQPIIYLSDVQLNQLQIAIKNRLAYKILPNVQKLNSHFSSPDSKNQRSIALSQDFDYELLIQIKEQIKDEDQIGQSDSENRQFLATVRPQIRAFRKLIGSSNRTKEENLWRDYAGKIFREVLPDTHIIPQPQDRLRARDLFTYALLLLEDDVVRDAQRADQDDQNAQPQRRHHRKRRGQTENLRRLQTVLEVAQKMQSPNGNFRWTWRDKKPRDLNAAEFCMRGAALICQLHKDRLEEEAPKTWALLKKMIEKAMNICLRKIPEKYTNIALLNAMNLILIGEALQWPKVAKEGYKRFENFCIYTFEWGIHEYVSTTYTAIQLMSIGLIQRYCKSTYYETSDALNGPKKCLQKQAKALLNFYILYGYQNWVRGTRRFGGTRSRKLSDYLKADGGLYDVLWVYGWPGIRKSSNMPINLIYPTLAALNRNTETRVRKDYQKIHKIIKNFKETLGLDALRPREKRLILQSWGANKNQSRTHYYDNDIALSCSHALYDFPDNQDMPLTIDIGNPPQTKRSMHNKLARTILKDSPGLCYFLPDTENDPYGKNSTHHAPLHWAAAQENGEALGMVLYQPQFFRRLESHLVFPIDEQTTFHFEDGSQIYFEKEQDSGALRAMENGAEKQGTILDSSEFRSLVMRRNDVAIGVKILWAQTIKGEPPQISFCYDKQTSTNNNRETIRAVRLTIQHHPVSSKVRRNRYTNAGAIFFVRVASNVSDDWHEKFAKEDLKEKIEETKEILTYQNTSIRSLREIKAKVHSLRIETFTPDQRLFFTKIKPNPSQAILDIEEPHQQPRQECNPPISDDGRKILNQLCTIKNYNQALTNLKSIELHNAGPSDNHRFTYWKPTDARVHAPMQISFEKGPSGQNYVWIPPQKRQGSDIGNATYKLNLRSPEQTQDKKFYIWARVQTDRNTDTPFRVRIFSKMCNKYKHYKLALWKIQPKPNWQWVPLDLNEIESSKYPTPLKLTTEEVYLQIFGKESSVKIQRFFITTDPDKLPTTQEADEFEERI